MTALHLIFYLFAAVAICSAIAVVTVRNPMRSVLSLAVTFFAMSGIWMMLRAEFLSLILLLVYVGAVMTLFLFVVMMLNINSESKQTGFVRYLPFGVIVVLLITGLTMVSLAPSYFGMIPMPTPQLEPADYSNIHYLGGLLYTDYAYAFEVAGVLLLASMIAAIALAHRAPHRRKNQLPSEQVAVRAKDRVRLITMPSVQRKEE